MRATRLIAGPFRQGRSEEDRAGLNPLRSSLARV